MSDYVTTPLENQFITQIVGEISSGATAPFDITVKKAISFTPASGGFYAILEPGTSKEEGLKISAVSGTTWTVSERGIPIAKGGASTATTHGGGATIIISNNWSNWDDIATAINSKAGNAENETISGDWTFTGDVVFSGSERVPVYADATARDAAITSPVNGMAIYNTADGKFQDYTAGSWVDRESGGTFANASTTVAGKVEIATQAELDAGTDTGGTGASLAGVPSNIAKSIQDNKWIYGASSAGSDTYAIALVPAVSAYATGQVFVLNADVANTGACTLNVNGLGAKNIKLSTGEDPASGDVIAGINILAYDGTNMVLVSNAGNAPFLTTDDPQKYWRELPLAVGYGEASADTLNYAANNNGAGTTTVYGSQGRILTQTAAGIGAYEGFYRYLPQWKVSSDANVYLYFDDFSDGDVIIYRTMYENSAASPANNEIRFGLMENITELNADNNNVAQVKFKMNGTQYSVIGCDGASNYTETNITVSNPDYHHVFEIILTLGTSAVFKVDDVIVHTETNIPLSTDAVPVIIGASNKATAAAAKTASFSNEPYIAYTQS